MAGHPRRLLDVLDGLGPVERTLVTGRLKKAHG